ncbi:hypothetical protein P7K49_001248 [Saguinus oedipus]|uniref:Uncharacterized protein n=1 Tax=Saguinus oedipus TaxID=9490 RepID=A0ABQ9WDW6_SAGOE|nr:hypothetical protein P7K49_001248 [Saguinus oedipus]
MAAALQGYTLQYYLNNYNSSLLTELILSLLGTYGPTQDYLDHCHKKHVDLSTDIPNNHSHTQD